MELSRKDENFEELIPQYVTEIVKLFQEIKIFACEIILEFFGKYEGDFYHEKTSDDASVLMTS